VLLFCVGNTVVVKNLQPGTTYILRVKAKNEVGFGNYVQLRVETKPLSMLAALLVFDSCLSTVYIATVVGNKSETLAIVVTVV